MKYGSFFVLFLWVTQGLALKCYQCPPSLLPNSDTVKENICFNLESGLDASPSEVDCGDGKTCYTFDKFDSQSDGSLLKVLTVRTCIDDTKVPKESKLVEGCTEKMI